jgi:DNA-binding NarL/FixJ family response regulator
VFYIDKQRLGRDCVSNQLAAHLPEWRIECASSIRDLQKNDIRCRPTSLVILNTHGASVHSTEVANEMAMITDAAPGSPLVILSDLDDATEVLVATRLGARGYLPASLPLPQAVGAIRLVGGGGTYIPACILLATSLRQSSEPPRPTDKRGNPIEFSRRQQQVLGLLQQGKQNKIIAYELGMRESTVKVHIRHIMRKLNARNRTQVVLLTNSTSNGYSVACAA